VKSLPLLSTWLPLFHRHSAEIKFLHTERCVLGKIRLFFFFRIPYERRQTASLPSKEGKFVSIRSLNPIRGRQMPISYVPLQTLELEFFIPELLPHLRPVLFPRSALVKLTGPATQTYHFLDPLLRRPLLDLGAHIESPPTPSKLPLAS
jgi:hypothetical protein